MQMRSPLRNDASRTGFSLPARNETRIPLCGRTQRYMALPAAEAGVKLQSDGGEAP